MFFFSLTFKLSNFLDQVEFNFSVNVQYTAYCQGTRCCYIRIIYYPIALVQCKLVIFEGNLCRVHCLYTQYFDLLSNCTGIIQSSSFFVGNLCRVHFLYTQSLFPFCYTTVYAFYLSVYRSHVHKKQVYISN